MKQIHSLHELAGTCYNYDGSLCVLAQIQPDVYKFIGIESGNRVAEDAFNARKDIKKFYDYLNANDIVKVKVSILNKDSAAVKLLYGSKR